MASISSIATSGMHAAQQRLQASAHNLANLQTDGFQRQQVVQLERSDAGGVDIATRRSESLGVSIASEVVDHISAQVDFAANVNVFRTADRMAGALLSVYA
jgi:flagellar basal-body rod protein FlgC